MSTDEALYKARDPRTHPGRLELLRLGAMSRLSHDNILAASRQDPRASELVAGAKALLGALAANPGADEGLLLRLCDLDEDLSVADILVVNPGVGPRVLDKLARHGSNARSFYKELTSRDNLWPSTREFIRERNAVEANSEQLAEKQAARRAELDSMWQG